MNETDLMLTTILNCKRHEILNEPLSLTQEQTRQLDRMLQRRAGGEPLQYAVGQSTFLDLNLKVDQRVLIPRPETEILVDQIFTALKQQEKAALNFLDLGCGSGNISLSLAKKFQNSTVVSLDVSQDALDVALENANRYDLQSRVTFQCQDMLTYLQCENPKNTFDVIVSNPPYIKQSDLNYLPNDVKQEPQLALAAGDDGLTFYKVIIKQAHLFLKADGWLFLEIGDGQRAEIERLFSQNLAFKNISFIKDYCQTDRIVMARMSSI